MKTGKKIIRLISVLFIFFYCQGNPELMNFEELSSLYGSWENYAIYPTYEVFTFIPPNRLEVYQFIDWPTSNDTAYYYGTYQIPYKNVMYRSTYSQIINQSVVNSYLPKDTLIYYVNNNNLDLYFEGRHYNKINISPDILLDSDYYRVVKASDSTYYHELYYFGKDTVKHYTSLTESDQIPKTWENVAAASYTKTDRQIVIYYDTVMTYGYKYYNGKLLLARHPRTYKKIKK